MHLPHNLLIAAALLAPTLPAQRHSADIVDTAVAAGSFETLATALKAAGLVATLKGEGPFTVFAPTDDAFGKLPERTLNRLLRPENKGELAAILTYHVVPGRLQAADVVSSRILTTVQGQRVAISVDDGGVRIDDARIQKTDIACRNGVIHVIDSVLLPRSANLVATAKKAGAFGTLLKAAQAAGLADTLAKRGPFTVFAPTDEAFAKIPASTLESLLEPRNQARLADILKFHVVSGRIYADQAVQVGSAKTLQGAPVEVALRKGRLTVAGAAVVENDVEAQNGVIHVIDTVLMPPAPPAPRGRLVIGIHWEKPSNALASQLGVDRDDAMLITSITKNGGAAAAGLREYDVITKVQGRDGTVANLNRAKEEVGFGNVLRLTILRGGKEKHVRVKVGSDSH